jgi:hypothetical protein
MSSIRIVRRTAGARRNGGKTLAAVRRHAGEAAFIQ